MNAYRDSARPKTKRVKVCKCDGPETCVQHQTSAACGGCPTIGLYETITAQEDGSFRAPRHRYDCDRCKYSWCCGPLCQCGLHGVPQAPEERLIEVAQLLGDWRVERGHERGDPLEDVRRR